MYKALENITIDIMTHVIRMKSQGWTDNLMDSYDNRQLAKAAACYALGDTNIAIPVGPHTTIHHNIFPWNQTLFTPKPTERENLIEAIGLLVEQVAVLDRQAERAKAEAEAIELEAAIIAKEAAMAFEMPAVLQRHIEVLEDTTASEADTAINRVQAPNGLMAALARVKSNPTKTASPPPRPSISAKIINIRDGLKHLRSTQLKTFGGRLQMMLFPYVA